MLYVLKPDGTVVDAFPGVYTPEDFLREVRPALDLARANDTDLQAWHRARALQMVPGPAAITVSKAVVEAPILARLDEPVVDVANPQASVDALSARLVDVSKRPADVEDLKATLGIPPGQVLTLHVPIDDPDLGLTKAIVPGTP